jgi:hypothetical protein
MRRTISAALLVAAALLVVLVPASAGAAKKKKHHAAAPAAIKTGTYKAKAGTVAFDITLKKASCAAAGPSASTSHLCVSLPVSPEIQCSGAVPSGSQIGDYSKPIALSPAGAALAHSSVPGVVSVPGSPPSAPGSSVFSVAFTKKGTATGYLELNMTITFGTATVPCASGKVPFTAKLG